MNIKANGSQDLGVATTITMDYMTKEVIKKYGNGCEECEDRSSLDDYDLAKDRPFKYTLGDSLRNDDILYNGYTKATSDKGDALNASKRRKDMSHPMRQTCN